MIFRVNPELKRIRVADRDQLLEYWAVICGQVYTIQRDIVGNQRIAHCRGYGVDCIRLETLIPFEKIVVSIIWHNQGCDHRDLRIVAARIM